MRNLPKIALRDIVEADLAVLYQIQCEPEGHKMAAVIPRDEEAFFRHWREKILSNKDVVVKIVEFDGTLIGDIISFIQEDHRTIGYWIAKEYWGRGIVTEGLRQFLALHEKRRPLSAFAATANIASYRVLQKCGFQQVGHPTKASDGVEEFRMELR